MTKRPYTKLTSLIPPELKTYIDRWSPGIHKMHPKTEYTPADIERGRQWYKQHRSHVRTLMQYGKEKYPMSGSDIGKPELWKPAAWRWFFSYLAKQERIKD